jgi:uncharacterized protein with GYD domain
MPIFITQGRYTREAMAGMMANPEDRTAVVSKLAKKAGCKLLGYYFTFGEYDFLTVMEGPDPQTIASVLIVAGSTGGVTDLRTTVAMTMADMKKCFAAAGDLGAGFRAAGS